MMAGLWHRPVLGFEWRDDLRPAIVDGKIQVDDPPEHTWWLVPLGDVARRYPVLSRTNLTRDFADVGHTPTRARILQFANRYGHLGSSTLLKTRGDKPTPPLLFQLGGEGIEIGERLGFWQTEAQRFWFAWDTWRSVDTASNAESSTERQLSEARRVLEERFGWNADGGCWYRMDVDGSMRTAGMITHPRDDGFAEISANIRVGDHVALARYWVMRRVNEELKGHVNATILPFLRAELRLVPDDLRTAIYLRFAMEVSEGIGRLRECDGCSRPFTPRRRDQRFCDRNCRERAGYRRRTGGIGTERDIPT